MKNTDKDIRATLAEAISEKRAELQRLEGALAILAGPNKVRRRKPSDEAISSNLVSAGGRLKGFREKIISQISKATEPMTTDEIAIALYDRGFGIPKAKMAKRIASTLQHMRTNDGTIRSKKNGEGRKVIWSLTKKGAAAQAEA